MSPNKGLAWSYNHDGHYEMWLLNELGPDIIYMHDLTYPK